MRFITGASVLLATILLCSTTTWADETASRPPSRGHHLLVWAGDRELKGNDFVAVIDADPLSPTYGRLVTTLATFTRVPLVRRGPLRWKRLGHLVGNRLERLQVFEQRSQVLVCQCRRIEPRHGRQ